MNPVEKLDFIKNIPQYPQKSKEWLIQRAGKLTSSDSGTALGINPYQKQHELLFKKCGYGPEFTGSEATFHGEKYETEAIEKYEKLLGKKNYEFGLISYSELDKIRRKQYSFDLSFLAGSPDGIAYDPVTNDLIMIEVKCPMRRKITPGYCPEYYYSQVQLNMLILDLDKADFIEYRPIGVKPFNLKEPEMNIIRIYRNEKWLSKMLPVLVDFWNQVLYWKNVGITNYPNFKKLCPKKLQKSGTLGTSQESQESQGSLRTITIERHIEISIENTTNNENDAHENENENNDNENNEDNYFINTGIIDIDFV